MKIIALGGYSKAGKDYVGRLLKDYYEWLGYKVEIEKFAKPLRVLLNGILDDNEKDKEFSFEGIETTTRNLMISIANGLKNEHGNDIFVKALIDRLKNNNVDIVIITDLRFITEERILKKEYNDYLFKIKIHRTNEIVDKSQEIGNLNFDYTYINNDKKSLSELIKIINENLGI